MNELLIYAIPAILLYLAGALLHAISLAGRLRPNKLGLLIAGSLAVILHAWFLHRVIDIGGVQNINVFNMLSVIFCVASAVLILTAIFRAIENLCLLMYPLAAISIAIVLLFPMQHLLDTGDHPEALIHIFLSIVTVSFMAIAALQALVLAWQERLLKSHLLGHWFRVMPSLQTMEKLLFQTIWLGFLLLTALMLSAWYLFGNLFTEANYQKTILGLLAWLIYAVLLFGRHVAGWRGTIAVNFTLIGFLVLIVAYFASQLLTMYR